MKILVEFLPEGEAKLYRRPSPWGNWLLSNKVLLCERCPFLKKWIRCEWDFDHFAYIDVPRGMLPPYKEIGDMFEVIDTYSESLNSLPCIAIPNYYTLPIEPLSVRTVIIYIIEHGLYGIVFKGWTWKKEDHQSWNQEYQGIF